MKFRMKFRSWLTPLALVAILLSMAQVGTVVTTRRLNLLHSGGTNCSVFSGSGDPEGAVVGKPCDAYLRSDAPGWYVKDAGTGTDNSGWVQASGSAAWADITGTPTTFSGYGIVDTFANWLTSATATRQGNTAKVVTYAGSAPTTDDCAKFDANGNITTAGAACGSGSGGVTSVDMTVPSFLSVSGNPVTSSGTLAVTLSGTALPFANGGTGLTSASDDTVMVSSGAAWVAAAVPDCTDTGGNHINYTASTNAFSCGTSGGGGGGTALSGLTAASASNTIASGNNHSQAWNWALTSNSVTAFQFGETTAASGGTSDNQVILGVNALATSTAIPLYVKNYGATDSFRVDDVSGDTTPFTINLNGSVGINTAPFTTGGVTLRVGSNGGNSGVELLNNTGTIGDFGGPAWGSVSSSDFYLGANSTKYMRFVKTSPPYLEVYKSAPPTTIVATSNYLNVGSGEEAVNGYYLIGFGYTNNQNNGNAGISPAFIGYQETSSTGSTNGDIVFGTRGVTTNTAATVRMRLLSDGTVNIDNLKTTGSAGSKNVVCVDTATGKLYASSTGTDCSN
jgi:hypothetical protein